eukprot:TRINITY_DN29538_c0_g1_i1.p2 TRINITY_DN29538_c0_g1~~TRINITY_DN29538_c0_g1_i1.p2  ORF type:complete len:140 (+),score=22.67 TRINITY_DN29538_c0_g1_i1:113-532(+)
MFFFFFSSRRRHTRCREVSWARRCVQETGCVLVDQHKLYACHFSKIFHVLNGQVVREAGVMCTTGKNPCCSTYFEIRLRNPKCTCNRQFRQFFESIQSTVFTIIRKRSPISTTVAATPGPVLLVNTKRAGSFLPPIPSG